MKGFSNSAVLIEASTNMADGDKGGFDKNATIAQIKKYLPAQAPLKDFIFQNNLESFLDHEFFAGLHKASEIFGYKTFLSIAEFRTLFKSGKIKNTTLDKVILRRKGTENLNLWKDKLVSGSYSNLSRKRIGSLRTLWNKEAHIDIDALVHPNLFRTVCSYLDQGISIWNFPIWKNGFLQSVREMEHNSFTSFFKTERPRKLLLEGNLSIEKLLDILVGDKKLYHNYLFDQQFAHQGWSGMVAFIEAKPESLMDLKKINLEEFIIYELLLEIDILESKTRKKWKPLAQLTTIVPLDYFAEAEATELQDMQALWQEAFEWSFYEDVLAGLKEKAIPSNNNRTKSFQAMFCIDDREISIRDHIEKTDPKCETFGTPGFFNVEFYYQPEDGKALTKLCPAPVTPKYLIKEMGHHHDRKKVVHFEKQTFSLSAGWVISQTLGFWTALELAKAIFKPSMTPATTTSFKHMDKLAKLSIENESPDHREFNLQVGFTFEEMADRVEGLLRSVGLTKGFAPIVYMIGHGASSVNNPFYATMDCGACSCRPGSVNARVFCHMANHKKVREILKIRDLYLPETTQFLGGLHDTTTDEIMFYDEDFLSDTNKLLHQEHLLIFEKALDANSKERSRRFESIDTKLSAAVIHDKIRTRAVSLFEPRPELDHATNALAIVGRRDLTKDLFLDRRSFLNSYDYSTDPTGSILLKVLGPVAPVCGGINMNYYFGRVDNQKLGAGTKLPHNVMGLFGVANGIDGDLRPGLPSQMVEAHDPIRLMLIIEHYPEIVLKTLKSLPTYVWYKNSWMYVVAIHPDSKEQFLFQNEEFVPYESQGVDVKKVNNIVETLEKSHSLSNIPVHIITQ